MKYLRYLGWIGIFIVVIIQFSNRQDHYEVLLGISYLEKKIDSYGYIKMRDMKKIIIANNIIKNDSSKLNKKNWEMIIKDTNDQNVIVYFPNHKSFNIKYIFKSDGTYFIERKVKND
jgi:hypothetical protein